MVIFKEKIIKMIKAHIKLSVNETKTISKSKNKS